MKVSRLRHGHWRNGQGDTTEERVERSQLCLTFPPSQPDIGQVHEATLSREQGERKIFDPKPALSTEKAGAFDQNAGAFYPKIRRRRR